MFVPIYAIFFLKNTESITIIIYMALYKGNNILNIEEKLDISLSQNL